MTVRMQSGLSRPLSWIIAWFVLPVAWCPCGLASGGINSPALPSKQEVTVHPGDDLRALVEHHRSGTVFHLAAGTYRLQSLVPRDGDAFIGEPGATLNGAQLLTGFSQSGNLWVAAVQVTPPGSFRGECIPSHPACKYPEDLFLDNKPLQRVESLSDVGPGKWYLDYSERRAFLAENPTGHTVEVSVLPFAIRGDAGNVRIEGLTIEKYATAASDGAVDGRSGSGRMSSNWVVQNNVVTLNHGMGIRLGDGMQVLANKAIENGQLGLGGGGNNGLVDGNEIARNNYAGYDYNWEAGGTKFAYTKNLTVRNNFVHDNDGPGLWTDLDNVDTLYDNNHARSNRGAGILHEVSYHAIIRNNVIEEDGFSDLPQTAAWYGAGIIIAGSSGVEVYGNTVTDCMNGIVGIQPRRDHNGVPYLLEGLNVHDNTITQGQGVAAGILCAGGLGEAVFVSQNNRFTNNQFHLGNSHSRYFAWGGAELSYRDWESRMHP